MKRGKVKRLKNQLKESNKNTWYWFDIWQDVNSYLIDELNNINLLDEIQVTENPSEDMIKTIELLVKNKKS